MSRLHKIMNTWIWLNGDWTIELQNTEVEDRALKFEDKLL